MSRGVVTLAVALALVLAGCSGFGGDPEPRVTETVTPAPVPEPAERGTMSDRVAPGLTEERLVDESALLSAHTAALANSPHTYRERVTRRYPNGTVQREGISVVRQDGESVFYRFDGTTDDQSPTGVERWSNGSVTYTRRVGPNGSTYSGVRGESIDLDTDDYTASLTRLFTLVTVEVNGTATRFGQVVYRVETPRPQSVPPLEDVTFVGYVTPEGVVTAYRVEYTVERPPTPVEVTVSVSVSDLGTTTVERPPWFERAVNATD